MDLLKKNVFLSACLGTAVVAVAVGATAYFTIDPGDAKAKYEGLRKGITAGTRTAGDVAKAAESNRKRIAEFAEIEKKFLARDLEGRTAIYFVYWGERDAVVAVDTPNKTVVVATDRALNEADKNEQRVNGVRVTAVGQPPVAGIVQVDPLDGSVAALKAWRDKNKGIVDGGFVRMPRTLHGRAFDERYAEEFQAAYGKLNDSLKDRLGGVVADKEFLTKLKAHYLRFRADHAKWVADIEYLAGVRQARSAKMPEPKKMPIAAERLLGTAPEQTPASLWRRAVARLGWIWWAGDIIGLENWAVGVTKPTANQMFLAQVKLWLLDDVVDSVVAVNGGPGGKVDKDRAPLSEAERKALWADRERWSNELAEREKVKKEVVPEEGAPVSKGGETGELIDPAQPKEPVFEEFLKAAKKAPLAPAEHPRQGVLGSPIKSVTAFVVWTGKEGGIDGWPFLPASEPIRAQGEAESAADPTAVTDPAAAPADPAAVPAVDPNAAPVADTGARLPNMLRIAKRPTDAERKDFRSKGQDNALKKGLSERKLPDNPLFGEGKGKDDTSHFGNSYASFTERGSTNDYFTLHCMIQVVATPAGVDELIRQVEGRRYFTLARPPDLRDIDRSLARTMEFGVERPVQATLYFECVLYHQTVRRLEDTATLLGTDAPAKYKSVIVSLMPATDLWKAFVAANSPR